MDRRGAFSVGYVVGSLVAILLGAILLPRDPIRPTYVPCAVPVYATQASTLEELERRAAQKMDLMRNCATHMQHLRRKENEPGNED